VKKRFKIPIIVVSAIIGIPLVIGLGIFSINSYTSQIDYEDFVKKQVLGEKEGPHIEITGFVDYRLTIEGPEINFVPEPTELYKIKETGRTVFNLEPSRIDAEKVALNQKLDGKKVRIEGVIKKLGEEYLTSFWPGSGLPTIITKKIEILEDPTINLVGTVQREKADPDYAFKMVIDEKESEIENKNELEQLYLVGHSVPLGERGKVRIQGHILNDIENYEKGFWDGNFHEIEGPVIFVTDIQLMN